MADPTFSDTMDDLKALVDFIDDLEVAASQGSGFLDKLNAALDTLSGSFEQELRDPITSDQAALASLLAQAGIRAKIDLLLPQIGVAINSAGVSEEAVDLDRIWADLADYMVDNTQSVNSRELVYGPPAAFAAGKGSLVRLTVDENAQNLEGWFGDTFSLRCIADARQIGEEHAELFELEGLAASGALVGELNRTGTGLVESLATTNARDSKTIVSNPSFNQGTISGTTFPAAPVTLTGWSPSVAGTFTNLELDNVITFRETPGDGVNYAIRMIADESLDQDIVVVNNAQIDPDTPYYIRVAVYRQAAATGNVTFRLGGVTNFVTKVVTLASLNDDAWNIVTLATNPEDYWPRSWNDQDLTLRVEVDTLAVGTVLFDDIVFVPFTRVGARGNTTGGKGAMGTYMVVDGGATPFVLDDEVAIIDTEGGSRGKLQYWLAISGRGYLRHATAGGETITDP